MAISLSNNNPAILPEDFGSSGASPSLTLTDTTASAEDYTLTADADKLTITSSQGAGGAAVVISGSLDVNAGVTVNNDGALSWGDNADFGSLSWDTGVAFIYGQTGKNLSLGSNNSADGKLVIESGGNIIINESGADRDFRVEGDTDANLLMVDASADKVGIGTATPGAKLEVRGTDNTSQIAWGSTAFEGGNLGYNGATDDIWLGNVGAATSASETHIRFADDGVGGGTNRVVFRGDGNVGIGHAAPEERLHISGGALAFDNTREIRWDDNGGTLRTLLAFDASNVLQVGHSSFITNFPGTANTFAGGITTTSGGAVTVRESDSGSTAASLSSNTTRGVLELYQNGSVSATISGGTESTVFNELGNDQDFRVEGDTDANALFVDASTDVVCIGVAGAANNTCKLDINGDSMRLRTAKTPASAAATGLTGQIAWDGTYFYICVDTNTWHRTLHATW